MRLTRRVLTALFAAAALAAPGLAAAQPDDDALVAKATAYLDAMTTVKANFSQADQHGAITTGTVYLARPGRARFEYAPPSGLLITSDGRTVIVSDSRLKTFQRFSLASTPLAVFLAEHIRFDRGASVVHVERGVGAFAITAEDAHGANGEIILYFDENPMRLTGWAISDPQRHMTRVTLGPLKPTAPPPDDAFTQTKP